MAQYKVPQDVEADDKLIGPFSFRQFVYLLIAGGLVALAIFLYQLFPLLVIIPLPFVLFFVVLALPLRKDQPMETYLAAIVSYYLKPHKRIWTPGQRESTIRIIAPKVVEESRVRDITGEEATHRLSFLANIVDTGGYAIKGAGSSPVRDDLIAEANAMSDMFENSRFDNLESAIEKGESVRHDEVVKGMRAAIERSENIVTKDGDSMIQRRFDDMLAKRANNPVQKPNYNSPVVVTPEKPSSEKSNNENKEKVETDTPNHSIIELANNPDYSVATIEKEAKRIKERGEGEVFISLH